MCFFAVVGDMLLLVLMVYLVLNVLQFLGGQWISDRSGFNGDAHFAPLSGLDPDGERTPLLTGSIQMSSLPVQCLLPRVSQTCRKAHREPAAPTWRHMPA